MADQSSPRAGAPALAAGAGGQRRSQPGGSKRAKPATLRTEQVFRHQGTIEVVYFGKRHVFTAAEFKEKAHRVKLCLVADHDTLSFRASILRGTLASLTPPWFMGVTAAVTEAPRRLWAMLTPEEQDNTRARWTTEVDALRERVDRQLGEIESALSAVDMRAVSDEHAMMKVGVELARLRTALDAVEGLAAELREDVTRKAEDGEAFAQGIADACLELALLARPPMAPGLARDLQEVTYRVGFLVVESVAQGLSAAATGSSFVGQVASVLRSRLPGIVQRLLSTTAFRWMGGEDEDSVRAAVLDEVVALCIDVVVWAFEGRPDEDLHALVEDHLWALLGKLLGSKLSPSSSDSPKERWARTIVKNLVEVVTARVGVVRRAAQESTAPSGLLWLEETPGLLAAVLGQLLTDLAAATIAGSRTPPSPTSAQRLADLWRKRTSGSSGGKKGRKFQYLEQRQAQTLSQRMGLTRHHLERLRRVAFERDLIMVVRRSSSLAHRHVDHPGREPKPLGLKAKTSREGPLAGLVVIEEASPPPSVRAMGCLVRSDGLVFHPKMVASWGRSIGQRDPALGTLVQLLERSAAEGQHGGFVDSRARASEIVPGMAARIEALSTPLRDEVARLHGLLMESGPKLGYYSDLDVYELIDAKSGHRIALGAPDDARVRETQANLEALNAAIKGTAPYAAENASLVQHGGASEARKADGRPQYGGYGDLVVIDADGDVFALDAADLSPVERTRLEAKARNQAAGSGAYEARLAELIDAFQDERAESRVERYLQTRLGSQYKTLEDRHQNPDPGRLAKPVEPPRLASPVASKLPTLPRNFQTELSPLPPARPLDLQASAVVRGLFVVHPHNAKRLERWMDRSAVARAWKVQRATGSVMAVDASLENLVLTAAGPGVDLALQHLGLLAQAATSASKPIRSWYELVAPSAFATRRQIMGILAQASPQLPTLVGALGRRASFATPPSERHEFVAFRATEALERGAVYSGDIEQMFARRLDIVWNPGLGAPWYTRPVGLADRPVAVLYGPLVTSSVTLRPGQAVVAPAWRLDYPLDTQAGLAAALVVLGLLDPAEMDRAQAIEAATRDIQAAELGLAMTGRLDDQTRAAIRLRLAELSGDGIIADDPGPTRTWPSLLWPVPGHVELNEVDKPREGHPHFGVPRSTGGSHKGIDIKAPVGARVQAVAGGKVVIPPPQKDGYGQWLYIDHGEQRVSTYAHLDDFAVKMGQRIQQGDTIGHVGLTGNSPGDAHLHFELREGPGAYNDMTPIDPWLVLTLE